MKRFNIPAPNFDLAMTLDSGQVFHWEKIGKGFAGTIGDLPVCVEQCGDVLHAKVAPAPSRFSEKHARDARATITHYFALDHPLNEICGSFPDDPIMNTARQFVAGYESFVNRNGNV